MARSKFGDGLLSHGAHHHIHVEREFACPGRALGCGGPSRPARPSSVRTHSSPVTTPLRAEHANRLRLPQKGDAVLLGELIFVGERGHLRLAAAVDQVDGFGAKPPRGRDHVDGGVARADAGDAAANLDFVRKAGLWSSR